MNKVDIKVDIKTAICHKILTNYAKIIVFSSMEGKRKPHLLWILNICSAGDDFLGFSF